MDHFCKYQPEFRVKERKYDSTNTFVIETTSVCVQACFICKKIKPKTPTDEFVSIRIYYDDELILGYEIIEEGDVCTERPVTCNWMDYVPRVLGSEKEDSLYIRISEIKKTNCKCKSCNFLKTYVDFIDDDHERT